MSGFETRQLRETPRGHAPHRTRLPLLVVTACAAVAALAGVLTGNATGMPVLQRDSVERAIRAAEDARAGSAASVATLMRGVLSSDARLQVIAVRAAGRLERAEMLDSLLPLLRSTVSQVRAEAANALAQSASGLQLVDSARRTSYLARAGVALITASASEPDAFARAAIARSIARLPHRSAQGVMDAEAALLALLGRSPDSVTVDGVVLALEALGRLHRRVSPPSDRALAALEAVARDTRAPARARRAAVLALASSMRANAQLVRELSMSGDAQLRRLAVVAALPMQTLTDREILVQRFLADSSQLVRLEMVRGFFRAGNAPACAPLVAAMNDSAVAVALAAIDALAQARMRCPARDSTIVGEALLRATQAGAGAESGNAARARMHKGSHALVVLARYAPAAARGLISGYAAHRAWVARVYAARAAAVVGDTTRLRTMARDSTANVRVAALEGLTRLGAHAFDDIYARSLGDPDYNVVLVGANALARSPAGASLVPQIVAAFARLSREQRQTSRDPRVALLERIAEFGSAADSTSLLPHVRDTDPVVAARTAQLLSTWMGRTLTPAPAPVRQVDVLPATLDSLARMRLRFTMSAAAGGGSFELELLAHEAPWTSARIVRLARSGYYNGLTFHRVVSNFVVQGGSPGANEYMGDGPFMRDEVWLHSHDRGTVGISTRGRDTGDAQIFINLVDNPRLDFDYTVFARVVSGMGVVDGLLEGDRIERVEVVRR